MTLKLAIPRRLRRELKKFVQFIARARSFLSKKGRSSVIAERKQFLSILGHAVAVYKFQGTTLTYMQGDLN